MFTPSKCKSEKDQRTLRRDQKYKQQASKKMFMFVFAFTCCGKAFIYKMFRIDSDKYITLSVKKFMISTISGQQFLLSDFLMQ